MRSKGSRYDGHDGIPKRGYGLSLVVLMAMISAVSILAYAYNMRAMGWRGNSDSALSIPVGLLAGKQAAVLLYASPDSARYLNSVGGNYEVLLKPWRNFFVQQRIPYQEVASIESLSPSAGGVLVLPSALAISDRERRAILQFRDRGGNILATGSLGPRDGSGEWVGYEFLRELLGVTITGEIPPDRDERHLNLFGDLPFSQSYGVAERIWLGKLGANPLRIRGGKTAGALTNWARTSGRENGFDNAAVLYDEFGSDKRHARWVMLNFPEVTWEIQRNDVHRFLSNALAWLDHRPSLYKGSWPSPYHAAHVIEMDTEEGFQNALRFAAMMDTIEASATFYALTSVAVKFPEVVRQLARRHEIGYHADVHEGFRGQPEAVQAKRLDTMQAQMKSILGDTSAVTGFRAPTESYDKTTEDLLLQRGMRHHAADPNRTNARAPLFYPNAKEEWQRALVVLPRTQLDDINLIRDGRNDRNLIRDELINDFNQVSRMGAFGLLSIHSQNFGDDSPLAAAMPAFLAHVKNNREQVWVAPAGRIADWWRDRERLTYKVTATRSKLDLDVTLTGSEPMPAVSLIVTNPTAKAALQVRPVKSNTALPLVKPIDDFRTALVFSEMRAGSYAYTLTFSDN